MNKQLQFLKKLTVLFSVSLLLCFTGIKAQSLNPGDLAVIGWNSFTDRVVIVTLVDIPAGTEIKITDRGWNNIENVFTTGMTADGIVTWTLSSAISAGTVLELFLGGSDDGTALNNLTTAADLTSDIAPLGYTTTDAMGIAGDQIFIYQGADSNPFFIFGLNNSAGPVDASNWNTSIVAGLRDSQLPNGVGSQNALTNGVNAIGLWGDSNQLDNVQYTGPTSAADRDTWLARITDISNWSGTDDDEEDLENPITSAPEPIVNITPPNNPPTEITLSNNTVSHSDVPNATVGTLSTVDPDEGDTHTYSLVSGIGDTDNDDFNIDGSTLRATDPLSLSPGSNSVRIRTTDNHGGFFEDTFIITVVDDVDPTVVSVGVPANGTYIIDDPLNFTVNISEVVTVTGTPQIPLVIGSTSVTADYVSGSGTSALVFRYIVQTGDLDTDGVALGSVIQLNGGSITDGSDNALTPDLNAVGTTTGVLVDGVPPTVLNVNVPADGTYGIGSTLSFTVNFNEQVTVDGGTLHLSLDIGGTAHPAVYGTGSGSGSLTFAYTVQAGDLDTDGIEVTGISLNGSTINDAAGNAANLALSGVENTDDVLVDGVVPTVTTFNPANGAISVHPNADLTITFDEAIALGTGTITIFDEADSAEAVINVANHEGSLNVSANVLTIDLPDGLSELADYYVHIASTAITDLAGNAYAGISNNTTWAFTTGDVTPPSGYSVTIDQPEIDLTNEHALSFTFSEAELDATYAYTISSDGGGTPLVGSGTITAVDQTVSDIDVSSLPNGELTLSVTLTDPSDNEGDPATANVIKHVNHPPVVAISTTDPTTFTEVLGDTPVPVVIDDGITVSDFDNLTLFSATVSITTGHQPTEDILAFNNDGSTMGEIDGSYDAGVLTLTSTGATATLAQWQAALQAVTYSNTSKAPNTDDRTITFVVNDGEDDSNPVTKDVSVIDVNDPPTIDAPPSIAVVEDVASELTGISFDDVDAGSADVEVTFSILEGNGALLSGILPGITLTIIESRTVILEGTIAAINDYIDDGHFKFLNTPGDLDDVPLNVIINDRGNTGGVGDSQTANGVVTITVRSTIPRITRVYSPDSDGHYGLGDLITIHVEFDREVIATEVGDGIGLLLETGVPDRFASYESGSGEETLVFHYTVQPGDEHVDLDYLNTGALELATGSTIESVEAGVGADLTLPTPGAAASLSGSNELVVDGIVPTALAKDITLELDADGVATLLPEDLNDGSSDNLTSEGDLVFTISQTDFDCSDVGPVEVTLTVTDEAGNESTTIATVTVEDVTDPIVQTRNLIVALDADGLATIIPEMVDDGSDDACEIATLVLSKTEFNSDDLGVNTITLTATDHSGNESSATATVVVIAFEDGSFVYDGTAKSLSIAGELPSGVEVTYTDNGQIEVDTYAVTATVDGGDDFNDLVLTAELEITKASLVDVITFNDDSFVYDGTTKSLAISGDLPDGVEVTYTHNEQAEAGVYTVTATMDGGNNYEDLVLTAELEIAKASLVDAITFSDDSFVYDGTAKSLAISGDLPDGVEVTYTGNGQIEVDIYTVTATMDGGNNYEDLVLTAELEITKASLVDVITFSDDSFVYDGTAKSLAILGDLPDGVEVAYTGNGQTEAGVYTVTATIDGGNNYEDLVLTATLEITAVPEISITFPSGSFVYDGTQQSLAIVGELPEGVTVTYTNNGRVNVGVQTVTATIDGGDNHQDTVLTATLEITPATRTLDFLPLPEKTYGDADFSANGTVSSGETVTYTSSDESVAEIVEGLIRITGAGSVTITATVPENSNYSDRPTATQAFVVHKATQAIAFTEVGEVSRDAGSIQLDVLASSGLPISLEVSDELVATLSGTVLNIHRLGTVHITATQEGDANHEAAEPVIITVRVVDPSSSFPVRVHQAVSPNGDGINDFLIIEGIRDYPENRVTILNRNGTIVWEASGYDNGAIAFRGIGTGQLRLSAGTYFYVVEVRNANGRWEHHKGYFVLRY